MGQARTALAASINGRIYYGWVMVFVAGLGIFASGPGQSHTFAAFNALIAEDLGIGMTEIAFAYGVATIGAAFLLPLVGRQVEKYGPRLSLMVIVLLLGIACIAFGAVSNFLWLMVGFGSLRFLGQGSLMLGSANLVAQWFNTRRGFAMGLMALGFAASMAIHPALSRLLIEWIGWREAWVALGLITWVLMLPVLFFIVQDKPEDMGLLPDNAVRSATDEPAPAITGATLQEALVHRSFYLASGGLFIMAGLVTTLHFHQYNLMQSQGMGADTATVIFWITAIAMVCLMPLIGRGFDRFRTRYMFAAGLCVQATALVAVTFVDSTPMLIVYGVIFGLNNAFTMTMFGYIWPRYFGRKHLGQIQGTGQMVGVFGASVGPIPVSWAFDSIGDPTQTLQLLAIVPLIFAVVVVIGLKTHPAVEGSEHLE